MAIQNEALGKLLNALSASQSTWSQSTFGLDSARGPLGAVRHLKLEAKELEDSILLNADADSISEELADCFLLILDASRRQGLSPSGLLLAASKKHRINESRKWPKPKDDENPVEHIE